MARILEQLTAAIERSDLSVYELARRSGVSKSIIYRLLNGNRSVSIDTLERLCDELRVEFVMRKKAAK